MRKIILTLTALAVALGTVSPIHASSAELGQNVTNLSSTNKAFTGINNNIQLGIFRTEMQTLTKNVEMISLLSGESSISSDTLWKASKESKYASETKPKNWGVVKEKSKGEIGSLTYVNNNTYKITKDTQTGLGKVKCSSVLKIETKKIKLTKVKCVNK